MTIFNLISLLGGLAFFLYGMGIMGSGLEKLAGGKTERVLQKLTSSTVKGVLLGAVVTGLIQSSSGATVIVIGLVNSGIMQFSQALGVVMGANIGTTVTAQIVRLSDLSSDNMLLMLLKPATLAPALAVAGAVLHVFSKSLKRRNVGQIMLGFSILFAGVFAMEGAVMPLRASPWFSQMFATLENPLLGVLAGALVTGIIQSSSASIGILQALTATGAITWGNAIPIILGQNIGTCITALIASVGATRAARRVAVSHVYFNVMGTLLWLCGLYALKAAVGLPFMEGAIDKGGIANFHTLFNVTTTLFFIPFSKLLLKMSEWTVPDRQGDSHPELAPSLLDTRLYASPAVAIGQARKAVAQMADIGRMNVRDAVELMVNRKEELSVLAQQREDVIDRLDVSVTNYLVGITKLELSEDESREVTNLLTFITEFERVGDYAINVVERGGEVSDKEIRFSGAAMYELGVLSEAVDEIFNLTIEAFTHDDLAVAACVEPLEETVDMLCHTLREQHIARLKDGLCTIDAGIVFLEALTDYERISDHCSNVAARLLSEEDGQDPHALRRSLHAGSAPRYNQLAQEYRHRYRQKLENPQSEGAPPALS